MAEDILKLLTQHSVVFLAFVMPLWWVAKNFEPIMKKEILIGLSAWINRADLSVKFKDWTYSFSSIYEKLYCNEFDRGGIYFVFPSFFRTSVISIIILLCSYIALIIYTDIRETWIYIINNDDISAEYQEWFYGVISELIWNLLFITLLYVPIYYCSVTKTKIFLDEMKTCGSLKKILYIIFDIILNTFLFIVLFQITRVLNITSAEVAIHNLVAGKLLNHDIEINAQIHFDNLLKFYSAAMLPLCLSLTLHSLWIAFFWISATFAKGIIILDNIRVASGRIFDADAHPLMVIAAAGTIIFTIIFWVPTIFYVLYYQS